MKSKTKKLAMTAEQYANAKTIIIDKWAQARVKRAEAVSMLERAAELQEEAMTEAVSAAKAYQELKKIPIKKPAKKKAKA
jgi:hypothetical protein